MRTLIILFFILFTFTSFAQELENKNYEMALSSFEEQDYASAMIHLKNTFKGDKAHLSGRILYAKILLAHDDGVAAELALAYAKELGGDLNLLLPLQAHAYLLQKQFEKAIEITAPATRDAETELILAYFRGQAFLGQKKFVFAEESFDYALKIEPNYAKANLGKAQVYITRKQFNLAIEFTDKALTSYSVPANARVIRARLYMIESKSIEAINILKIAIKKDENYLAARLLLAEIFLSKGEMTNAEKEIDYILDLAPKEPKSNFLKLMVSSAKNEAEDKNVEQTFNNILSTVSSLPSEVINENPQYLFLAGYVLFKKNRYLEAQKFFSQYLAKVDDLRAIKIQGKIELLIKDYASAKRLLSKANHKFPNQEDIIVMLGKAHMALNEHVKAQYYLQQALLINEDNIDTLLNLTYSYMEQLNFHGAMAELGKVRQTYPNLPQALLLEYQCLTELGLIELAQARTNRLTLVAPNNPEYYYLHGLTYFKLGDFESAKYYFNTAIEVSPNSINGHIGIADIDIQNKNIEIAIKNLQKLLNENPNNIKIMNTIAKAFQTQGSDELERVWLEKVLAIEKVNKEALISLERNHRKTGKLEAIKSRLKTLVKNSPNENLHQLLGGIYLTTRDYPKAIEQFKEKLYIAKDKGEAYLTLANAQVTALDIPGAIITLEKAIIWNDDLIEANVLLTKLFLANKDLNKANTLIDFIRKKNPDLAIADLLQGDWYFLQKQYQLALKNFQLAYNKNQSEKSILSLYRTYKAIGSTKKAEALLTNNLNFDANFHLSIIIALADIYTIQEESIKAIELYITALKYLPESVAILNNLANLYIENNKLGNALDYAKKAHNLAPENVVVIDTLATVFLRMKKYDTSLSLLRKAISVNSEAQAVKYHIALALDGLGRRKAAINQLIKVVESKRNFKEKKQAKALLDSWIQG